MHKIDIELKTEHYINFVLTNPKLKGVCDNWCNNGLLEPDAIPD